jgi:hypothetical protein
MRRRQPTPSSSSSDNSDGSDIESCFDIKDEQEETDADTEPTDVDTDVNDVDDVEGGDEADLAWIAGEDNAHPPEYYLDQENDSDESGDEDEDYSDNSILLLDMIEGQFNWYVPYSLLSAVFYSRVVDLTLFTGTVNILERIPPRSCRPSLAALSRPSSNRCLINVGGRVGGGLQASSRPTPSGHTGRFSGLYTNGPLARRSRAR